MKGAAVPSCRSGCGAVLKTHQLFCRVCWDRLPADLRAPITEARAKRAWALASARTHPAIDWLKAHPVSALAARIMGERA